MHEEIKQNIKRIWIDDIIQMLVCTGVLKSFLN